MEQLREALRPQWARDRSKLPQAPMDSADFPTARLRWIPRSSRQRCVLLQRRGTQPMRSRSSARSRNAPARCQLRSHARSAFRCPLLFDRPSLVASTCFDASILDLHSANLRLAIDRELALDWPAAAARTVSAIAINTRARAASSRSRSIVAFAFCFNCPDFCVCRWCDERAPPNKERAETAGCRQISPIARQNAAVKE